MAKSWKRDIRIFILLLPGVLFLLVCPTMTFSVTIVVDPSETFQTIEGFGGGLVFGEWPYGRACKDELYDSLFTTAGFSVIRINNTFDPECTDTGEVPEIPMVKEIRSRYPHVKMMLTSWSPPRYLKERDTTAGKFEGKPLSLKKENGEFVYDQYAEYWCRSIDHFQRQGSNPDWVSIQNEPDWPASWNGCYMIPYESEQYASYGKALDAVYNKVKENGVRLVGPDMTGVEGIGGATLDRYMENLDVTQLSGICHHLYNGNDLDLLNSVRKKYPDLPRYQTEKLINEEQEEQGKILTWFDQMKMIHNTLVEEDVSMYLLFALTYKAASTHCCFSIDSTGESFTPRPIYHAFKHYSKSVHRGWKRIKVTGDADPNLKVSAFSGPKGDSCAIVVVNCGDEQIADVSLSGVRVQSGMVHQTVQDSGTSRQLKVYEKIDDFTGEIPAVILEKRSVTTIDFCLKGAGTEKPVKKAHFTGPVVSSMVTHNGMVMVRIDNRITFDCALTLQTVRGEICSRSRAIRPGNGVFYTFGGPFAPGVYFLKAQTAAGSTMSKLIVP